MCAGVVVLPARLQSPETRFTDDFVKQDVGGARHLDHGVAVGRVPRDHDRLVGRRDPVSEGGAGGAVGDVERLDDDPVLVDDASGFDLLRDHPVAVGTGQRLDPAPSDTDVRRQHRFRGCDHRADAKRTPDVNPARPAPPDRRGQLHEVQNVVAVEVGEEHPIDPRRRQAGDVVPPAGLECAPHHTAAHIEQVGTTVVDHGDAGAGPIHGGDGRPRAENDHLGPGAGRRGCEDDGEQRPYALQQQSPHPGPPPCTAGTVQERLRPVN